MRISITRAGLTAALVGTVLLAAACQTLRHTGINGELRLGSIATTAIAVPAGGATLSVSGMLRLDAGAATVALRGPEGSEELFSFPGSEGPGRFAIGPYSIVASEGQWSVSVAGGEGAAGSYEVFLDLSR